MRLEDLVFGVRLMRCSRWQQLVLCARPLFDLNFVRLRFTQIVQRIALMEITLNYWKSRSQSHHQKKGQEIENRRPENEVEERAIRALKTHLRGSCDYHTRSVIFESRSHRRVFSIGKRC
ncbi:hypothetical protein Droror1_Dr00001178 [Drosera rotundifolia]